MSKITGLVKIRKTLESLRDSEDLLEVSGFYKQVDAKYFNMLHNIDNGSVYDNEEEFELLHGDVCTWFMKKAKQLT